MRLVVALSVELFAVLIASPNLAIAQPVCDVTIATPFGPGQRPTIANFYYNDRAVGSGREAFQQILQEVAKLPEGTSIVLGPDYSRCGACSGREPSCLTKHLYPDLWEQFSKMRAERKLTLSGDYPGPFVRPVGHHVDDGLPTQIIANPPPADLKFASELDWDIDPKRPSRKSPLIYLKLDALDRFQLDLHLAKLPPGSSALVRLIANDDVLRNAKAQREFVDRVVQIWPYQVGASLRQNQVTPTLAVPKVLVPLLKGHAEAEARLLRIAWKNFHGPGTPQNEVMYLLNGDYVGRGDQGIAALFTRIDKLERGWSVQLPQYDIRGRAAFENLGPEEAFRRSEALKDLVPFANRRQELIEHVTSKGALLSLDSVQVSINRATVLDWSSGDRYAARIVSFGHIVRHDEVAKPTALKLSWTGYDANQRKDRALETSARYTVNDKAVGTGVDGFAKAIQQIEALPEKSVIHVKVCVRTKGPFLCPLIYEGQRHFERTGFEPYFGMFEWLIDVAKKRHLEIEWIPDEAEKGCKDCALDP